jgi:hypothetical protein
MAAMDVEEDMDEVVVGDDEVRLSRFCWSFSSSFSCLLCMPVLWFFDAVEFHEFVVAIDCRYRPKRILSCRFQRTT